VTNDAVRHFEAKLRFETDPSDVAAARAAGEQILLLDVRSRAAWDAGHVPGALHIPGEGTGRPAGGVTAAGRRAADRHLLLGTGLQRQYEGGADAGARGLPRPCAR
jgi:3-mercaptopyruvate sulfurtransferase SseA